MALTYADNLRLNELEYRDRRTYLNSLPVSFTVVLGNTCNIRCGHCYQAKNGDGLLKAPRIGRELRREFAQFYPYISTLRLMGGEVFAMDGFEDLLDDAAAAAGRPIVSVCTNGTLIGDTWAEKIVRTPFAHLTVSIDGGTPETYNRIRRGADLNAVLANIERIGRWKRKLGGELPYLSSFFVVMRSNFREIPLYLERVRGLDIKEVTLEAVRASNENIARNPDLMAGEEIATPGEVAELHGLLRQTLEKERANFRRIRFSGITALFERYGMDAGFLEEDAQGLYPDSDQLAPRDGSTGFELCPNPWTTLFITENGDVRICFLSEPIGNLFETPLAALWNCPQALTMRRRMMQGRYAESGCSISHCSWREGVASGDSGCAGIPELEAELRQRTLGNSGLADLEDAGNGRDGLASVRRMLDSARRRIAELESVCNDGFEGEVERLKEAYDGLLRKGQRQIDQLESMKGTYDELLLKGQRQIDQLENKSEKATADFRRLEREFASYRRSPLVRVAHKVSSWLARGIEVS